MAFENFEPDTDLGIEDAPPPGMGSNRTFFIVAGILGGLMLLTLVSLAAYALFLLPQRREAQATQVAQIEAQNREATLASEQTAQALAWTDTPTATRPADTSTPTSLPSPTRVVAQATGGGATPTLEPRTATVAALLTQAAAPAQTATPTSGPTLTLTATASTLPQTGFADEVGLPALGGLALLLIAVIVLARRLRYTF